MNVSSVANWDIGAQVCIFPSCAFCQNLILFSQIVRRIRLVPIPSHLRGFPNVEEVVAAANPSEEREVEEAGRKSPLLQLQMIIEFDEIRSVFSYL